MLSGAPVNKELFFSIFAMWYIQKWWNEKKGIRFFLCPFLVINSFVY